MEHQKKKKKKEKEGDTDFVMLELMILRKEIKFI